MKLGAQLFTVRDFAQTTEGIASTLRRVAQIGYQCIQVSGIGPIEPERLRDLADRHSLEIVITHADRARIADDTAAVIREHEILGCRNIGIGSFGYIPGSAEEYEKFIRQYQGASRMIRDSGMKLHYHNHAFEFQKFNGKTGFDMLLEGFDAEQVGIILDTYWVQVGGIDPAGMILRLKGRIDAIHFKDLAIENNKQKMTEVMEGNLDWAGIIDACNQTNVRYALVEQDCDWTVGPFESLETGYRNLSHVISIARQ
jgi:sugar phosphate isomerase/epimerase